MGGVPPKHPSQRRRRNKPPVPPRSIPGSARVSEIPELPGDEWEDWTREIWNAMWEHPIATTFETVDFPALVRLMQLTNRVALGTAGAATLNEMRQLEDRYGLSPLSRRRLQIDITDEDEGEGEDRPDAGDDGRWLRAVGSEG